MRHERKPFALSPAMAGKLANAINTCSPIQSVAYKQLSFEMGLWLQIKKSYKNQNETIAAGKEENEEMSKEHDKNIHTAGYICGTWLFRWLRDIDLSLYIPHFLSIFIRHIQFKTQ